MEQRPIKTVPNQRVIDINKSPANKQNLYTTNNLSAIDEAAARLQSTGGFKLYIYFAKNQNKYSFALSSADFQVWSGLGRQAYKTAFEELIQEGYLIANEKQSNRYYFYDKSQKEDPKKDNTIIDFCSADDFIF